MLGKKRGLLSRLSVAYGVSLLLALIALFALPLVKPFLELSDNAALIYQQQLNAEKNRLQAELQHAEQLIHGLRDSSSAQSSQRLQLRVEEGLQVLEHFHKAYHPRLVEEPLEELLLNSILGQNNESKPDFVVLDKAGRLLQAEGSTELPLNLSVLSLLQAAIESEHQGFVAVDTAEATQVPQQLWYYTYFEPMGWYIASSVYYEHQQQHLQQQALDQLSRLRYLDDGYFLVLNQNGELLMDASNTNQVGVDALSLQNNQQQMPFKALHQQALQQGQATANIAWPRPNSAYDEDKYFSAVLDAQWQWVIIGGIYPQPLQLSSQQLAQQKTIVFEKHVLLAGIIALAVFVVILLLQRLIQSRAQVGLIKDTEEFAKALKSGKEVNVNHLRYLEWDKLALLANLLVKKRQDAEQELQEQSTQDLLTGAVSRRELMTNLEQELSRCARYILPMTYLSLELSQFKGIVAEHGHAVGDILLKDVTTRLKECLRNVDVVGRIGGEEFAAILPQTGGGHAHKVAERLNESISQHKFMHNGKALRVGLSVGSVSIEAGCRYQFSAVLERANSMLNDAKQQATKPIASCLLAPTEAAAENSGKLQLPEGLLKTAKKD